MIKLHNGNCLTIIPILADNSVDSIITDPPYELGFMGKSWDNTGIAYNVAMWKECYRVLKPGGHLLAFGGTRTYHRMAVAIEDAGFEIRDMIEWVYGSGFPKSLNIGKAVDKLGGESLSWFINYILQVADEKGISRKELTMLFPSKNGNPTGWLWNKQKTQGITLEQYHKIKEFLQLPFANINECERQVIGRGKAGLTAGTIANFAGQGEFDLTKGTSKYEGWGTALKPAHEPICMARKPLAEKTVAENCLKYGTGGINIDESRVGTEDMSSQWDREWNDNNGELGKRYSQNNRERNKSVPVGRFPANLIHDNSEEVRECFPETGGGGFPKLAKDFTGKSNITFRTSEERTERINLDSGNASRFFKSIIYTAKASKGERNKGCDGLEETEVYSEATATPMRDYRKQTTRANNHPTVKPIALMQYLINMVTPNNGTVLDPFLGSGTTGVACVNTNRNFIGIEMDDNYFKIAEKRIKEAGYKLF
jgi:DNA modification methylase